MEKWLLARPLTILPYLGPRVPGGRTAASYPTAAAAANVDACCTLKRNILKLQYWFVFNPERKWYNALVLACQASYQLAMRTDCVEHLGPGVVCYDSQLKCEIVAKALKIQSWVESREDRIINNL